MSPYSGPYFFHQLGNQDRERCLELLQDDIGSGAIFSPRHMKGKVWKTTVAEYRLPNKELLVDPQYYDLSSFQAAANNDLSVGSTGDLVNDQVAAKTVAETLGQQRALGATKYLLPCKWAETYTERWLATLESFAEAARNWCTQNADTTPILSTIAISSNIVQDEETIQSLLNDLVALDVEGFYLVVNVDEKLSPGTLKLLRNLLGMVFALKRNSYYVLLGYCDYWAMLAFPFGVDAFAAGGWENRRTFKPTQETFDRPKDQMQRQVKYSSRFLLGRVVFPFEAEVLNEQGIWNDLRDVSPYSPHFDGLSPSEVSAAKLWREGDSFRHYLWTMHQLAEEFRGLSLPERVGLVRRRLNLAADMHTRIYQKLGVSLKSDGRYIEAWREAFESALGDLKGRLMEEFG